MSKGPRDVEVQGTKYRIEQFGGETAADIAERFLLGFATGKIQLTDLRWLRKLLIEQTKVGVVDEVGDKRVTYVSFEDLPGGFNEFFRGRPLDILAWEKAAVEVSFGDLKSFFDVLEGIGRAQREAFDSNSPPASAGSSGGSSPASASTSAA